MGIGYGAFLDGAGRLMGLAASETGSYDVNDATFLGTVAMHPDGSLDVDTLVHLLDEARIELGIEHLALVLPPLTYDQLPSVQGRTRSIFMRATQAMVLQHAVHRLPAACDMKLMALNCTMRGVEVGLFDYGDGVVEDLAVRVGRSTPGDGATTIREVMCDAFRDAGLGIPPAPPFLVMMAAEDAGVYDVAERVLQELFGREVTVVRKSLHDIVVGATDRSAIRTACDYTHGFLPLTITPYTFTMVIDGAKETFIVRGTTIPTQKTRTYELGVGRDACIEVDSPYVGDAALTYFIPSEALYEIGATSDESSVEFKIDVDWDNIARLMLKGPNGKVWKERLDDLPRERGGSRVAGSPSVREAQPRTQPQPSTSDVPDELMRLIGLLDEVDLGMKSVSSDALKTPAGQVASTLQARLLDLIAEVGGTYYQALGQTFDPHVHEAAATIDNPVFPANYVVEEIKRGFRYHGKIVRYSVVRVANPR